MPYTEKSSSRCSLRFLSDGFRMIYCSQGGSKYGILSEQQKSAAYFGKEIDCHEIFDRLEIHSCEQYERHLNQHDVINITFNEMPNECRTYRQYITRIEKRLMADLTRRFPGACIDDAATSMELSTKEEIFSAMVESGVSGGFSQWELHSTGKRRYTAAR